MRRTVLEKTVKGSTGRIVNWKKTGAAAMSLLLGAALLSGCSDQGHPGVLNTEGLSTEATEQESESTSDVALPGIAGTRTYGQVAMGGGGFVTGLISTCESGVYYARTDVGGAYRWDKDQSKWICLSYDISEEDRGYLGVDGLAVDPTNAAKVYMICATSYFSGGRTAIFVSEDYGAHFERYEVTDLIKNHGNGMGRQNGERIAVDPNNPNMILAGGRSGGIIRSKDGGKTWESIGFPVDTTENGNGICSIVFDASAKDADGNTSRIFAAVSDKGENIYVSEDSGATWNTVDGLPTEYMPERMKLDADGDMLVTYGGAEGPWNGSGGAIYRFDTETKEATDISPADKSFGDVVCDPTNADHLFASTENIWSAQPNGAYGDEYYVSVDGGKNWSNILENMTMDPNGVDWIKSYAIHWSGSIMIDPVETGKIMVTSGNGIFACDNIWDEKPAFYFNAIGLEETVPLEAVSIPGGPLVTAIGDYDGFIHEDIFKYPSRHSTVIGTNTSIAVAGVEQDVWVRVGNDTKKQNFLYTEDGGKTWTNITNKAGSTVAYGGHVAVTADGKTFIWAPEGGSGSCYYTTDRGESWKECSDLPLNTYIIADPVNPNYVYGTGSGSFWVSSDGGATWATSGKAIGQDTRCAVVPGVEGTVYIGANMKGVLVSKDFGATMEQIDSVVWCSAVSTGKGLDDDTPALYIWGTPKQGEGKGIYMSLDGGLSWTRMNDDGVLFGGPGNGQFIVGDQNTVGRCYMSTVGLGLIWFEYQMD